MRGRQLICRPLWPPPAAIFPPKQRAALSGFTRANSERAIPPLLKQKQKPSLHPFLLTLKGTNQNSGRLFAGLTHSLLPQLWDSKGTSPFGRISRDTSFRPADIQDRE